MNIWQSENKSSKVKLAHLQIGLSLQFLQGICLAKTKEKSRRRKVKVRYALAKLKECVKQNNIEIKITIQCPLISKRTIVIEGVEQ